MFVISFNGDFAKFRHVRNPISLRHDFDAMRECGYSGIYDDRQKKHK